MCPLVVSLILCIISISSSNRLFIILIISILGSACPSLHPAKYLIPALDFLLIRGILLPIVNIPSYTAYSNSLDLCIAVARQASARYKYTNDYDDVYSIALQAAIKGIDHPSYHAPGFLFSLARRAIQDYFRAQDPLSRKQRKLHKRGGTSKDIELRLSIASAGEIIADITEENVAYHPCDAIEKSEALSQLDKILCRLDSRTKDILLSDAGGESRVSIGERLGISSERVRQIVDSNLPILKQLWNSSPL